MQIKLFTFIYTSFEFTEEILKLKVLLYAHRGSQ